MQPPPPKRIVHERFVLRSWCDADAAALRPVLESNDAHLRRFTPWVVDGREPGVPLDERLARFERAFDAGELWSYAMFDHAEQEILGGCGLYPRVGPGAVEVGYWLAERHTGAGLATLATLVLTNIAFAAPDIERVEIHCAATNIPSNRIPERLGFKVLERESADTEASTLIKWFINRDQWLTGPNGQRKL